MPHAFPHSTSLPYPGSSTNAPPPPRGPPNSLPSPLQKALDNRRWYQMVRTMFEKVPKTIRALTKTKHLQNNRVNENSVVLVLGVYNIIL